jgi:hypothetical protein
VELDWSALVPIQIQSVNEPDWRPGGGCIGVGLHPTGYRAKSPWQRLLSIQHRCSRM